MKLSSPTLSVKSQVLYFQDYDIKMKAEWRLCFRGISLSSIISNRNETSYVLKLGVFLCYMQGCQFSIKLSSNYL